MARTGQKTNALGIAPFLNSRMLGAKASAATCQPTLTSGVTALSVEFVAKPEEALRVQSMLPAALEAALKDVTGFAGCLIMVSDQEARLVTVVTLWAGPEGPKRGEQNARWVHALLAPYVDRYLRVQTLLALAPGLPTVAQDGNGSGACSMIRSVSSEEENVCVA